MYEDERLKKIEQLLIKHDGILQNLSGKDEAQKRYMRDLMSNLDEDNVPSLKFKVTKGQMTAAINAYANESEAAIDLLLTGYYTKAAINLYISEIESEISLAAQYAGTYTEVASAVQMTDKTKIYKLNGKFYRWNGTAWIETAQPPVSQSLAAIQLQANQNGAAIQLLAEYDGELEDSIAAVDIKANANKSNITLLSQFTGQSGVTVITDLSQRTDITKVYKLGTTYYRHNGTAWVTMAAPPTSEAIATIQAETTANGSAISLVAQYTGQDDAITVATWSTAGKNTALTYYATNTGLYYKYNGTAWVGASNVSQASFMLAAINGQSGASLKADRIDFVGFTTFLKPSDVGSGGSTTIDGARITTGQIDADRIEANIFATKAGLSGGTTTISGDCITTGNISADYIGVNANPYMTFHAPILLDSSYPSISGINDLNFSPYNYITDNGYASSAYGLEIYSSKGVNISGGGLIAQKIYNSDSMSIDVQNGGGLYLGTQVGSSEYISIGNGNGNMDITGSSIYLWGNVYINNVLQTGA